MDDGEEVSFIFVDNFGIMLYGRYNNFFKDYRLLVQSIAATLKKLAGKYSVGSFLVSAVKTTFYGKRNEATSWYMGRSILPEPWPRFPNEVFTIKKEIVREHIGESNRFWLSVKSASANATMQYEKFEVILKTDNS